MKLGTSNNDRHMHESTKHEGILTNKWDEKKKKNKKNVKIFNRKKQINILTKKWSIILLEYKIV